MSEFHRPLALPKETNREGLTGVLQRNFGIFAELSQEDHSPAERPAPNNVREVAARRDLIREGEKPRGVNLILAGWACGYKQLPDGRRQIISFLIPGDLADANVFILGRMDYSIGAITPVRYAEIGPASFEQLMVERPHLSPSLGWRALATAAINREWILNIGQRGAYERLAHLLCELLARLGAAGLARGDGCDFPLTQTDLAEATGLTPIHVNRTLRQLRRDGLIELSRRKLTVPDPERLRSVASFNPDYLHLDREGGSRDASERENR